MRKPLAFLFTAYDVAINPIRKLIWTLRCDVHFGPNVWVEAGCRFRATDGGKILIGEGSYLYARSHFNASGASIVVGQRCLINEHCNIAASSRGGIVIGDDALIAEGVTIRDGNHGIAAFPYNRQPMVGSRLEIGQNVWIGSKATILKSVCSNAVIGAGAVVTRPIDVAGIFGGVPARRLKDLQVGVDVLSKKG